MTGLPRGPDGTLEYKFRGGGFEFPLGSFSFSQIISVGFPDNNNFKKYSHGEGDYYGEGYDFDSVMHYGNWAFTINEDMTIQAIRDPNRVFGQREGFSQTDVRQLNKVYRCRGYENVKVPPLTGNIIFRFSKFIQRVDNVIQGSMDGDRVVSSTCAQVVAKQCKAAPFKTE